MAENDSLLREVDEAVRHDRLMALWRQYRMPVLAASIALIVATAGASLWDGYREQRAGKAMAQMTHAQAQYDAKEYEVAAESFAATADLALSGELKDLAGLWQGRALARAGKNDDAVARFEEVANRPQGSDPIWRDLACLRLVGLDSNKAACLKSGASPLAAERDLVRAALLWQDGKTKEATALLTKLVNDPDTGEATRTRAQRYLSAVETHAAE